MRWRVFLVLLAAGCLGHGRASLPTGPADCAGPVRPAHRAALGPQWRFAVESSPTDLWLGLSRTVTPSQALALTRGTRLMGLAFVVPQRQGTYETVLVPMHNPATGSALVAAVPPLSPLSLDPRRPMSVTAAAAARFARGDIPIVALRIMGSRSAMARVLKDGRCDVYSLAPGRSGSPPGVSERANPGG